MVAPLNRTITQFLAAGLPIIASRDWHPATTSHFQPHGGPWPVHCVQHSDGAAFHPNLRLPASTTLLSKGMDDSAPPGAHPEEPACHSPLRRRPGHGLLRQGHGAQDGLRQGFAVVLLRNAVAAVNIQPEDGSKTMAEVKQAGAAIVGVDELVL